MELGFSPVLQWLLNGVVTIVFTTMGFLIRSLWQAHSDLRKADAELANKVNAIELLVKGEFMTRQEFHSAMDKVQHMNDTLRTHIDHQFSNLYDKLDKKADRRS